MNIQPCASQDVMHPIEKIVISIDYLIEEPKLVLIDSLIMHGTYYNYQQQSTSIS